MFQCTHVPSDRRFAIKVMTPTSDIEVLADFENEGRLLQTLNGCDGIINYVDGGAETFPFQGPGGVSLPIELRFHVLVLADGNLEELLRDPSIRSDLGWTERLRIWREAVRGVMQMHRQGVVHRDLKSSNCLLVVNGKQTTVRLTDLGRAKSLTVPPVHMPIQYQTGRGDFRFAAPEALFWQAGSSADDFRAADYYGLGSLLTELVSGQPMTALAIGDYRQALIEGRADFDAGVRRDLDVLVGKYRHAVSEVVETLPLTIQDDARHVLSSLCHPDPSQRALASFSRDRHSRDRLSWVLRRTDIMTRRLSIEARALRLREKVNA